MKRIIFILFFVLQASAQNLISNPSFEDTVACPNGFSLMHYAVDWSNPVGISSPDYFNECNNSINGLVGVPSSLTGYQLSRTGVAYAGVALYTDSNSICNANVIDRDYKEFIQNELIIALDTGITYCGGYWVNLSSFSTYASDGFGMTFGSTYTFIPMSDPKIIAKSNPVSTLLFCIQRIKKHNPPKKRGNAIANG